MAAALFLGVLALGAVVVRSARGRTGAAWLAEPLPVTSQEASVVMRYLNRHQTHRAVGATLGVILAVVAGVRLYGEVTIGIGRRSPLADVLFCGLAGSIVGTLSAETFRLTEPRRVVSAASLAARTPVIPVGLVRLSRTLTAGSLAAGAAILVVSGDAGPAAIAAAGATLAVVAEATRRAVRSRQRPVMSDRARWVDNRMRWFAHRTVGLLQAAAAWLVLGWVVSKTGGTDRAWADVLRFVVVLGCLVAAIVHLHRGAPRRPRGWVAAP
jgi:hypothetical protein